MNSGALTTGNINTRVRALQGVKFRVLSSDESIVLLDREFAAGQIVCLAFANAHTINLARKIDFYRDTLSRFMVFNDGLGVDLASRLRYGSGFPSNLNGTDFVPDYLSRTKNKFRIFMLGAKPDVVGRAFNVASLLYPTHEWVGYKSGYFTPEDEIELIGEIRSAEPDLLLVAMGNPLQEYWIDRCSLKIGVPLYFGVGALFDFWAGSVNRAPKWVRGARLEWMYRLLQEPSRLWKRYLLGNFSFLWHAWKERR